MTFGFLSYDLGYQIDTTLCQVQALTRHALKVFPVVYNKWQTNSVMPHLPASASGRHIGSSVPGSTAEAFISNVNWRAAWVCARDSDVVVLWGLQAATALLCFLCAKARGKVIIAVSQTVPLQIERQRRWWIRLLKTFILRGCNLHIYQTPATKKVLSELYCVAERDLMSAPYSGGRSSFQRYYSGLSKTRAEIRAELELGGDVTYLYVGNLIPFKGIEDLLRACAQLPNKIPYRCVIVGRALQSPKLGDTAKYFSNVAASLGLSTHVTFVCEQPADRIAEIYLASDVLILPTHRDTFGKVLVEAALAGKPLITTDASGAAGVVVRENENGFIVRHGDVTQLAERMCVLADFETREQMGRRSKEIIDQVCTQEGEIGGLLSALERAGTLV